MANSHISLENGNIFFSNLQTITVTVNCVGVMGKGIALQAKDLFPDAFLYYKDLCDKDKMHMGTPVLYDKPSKTLQNTDKEYISYFSFQQNNIGKCLETLLVLKKDYNGW